MYTIEMAYARMRELQDLANRSGAHQPATAERQAPQGKAAARTARARKR
ncbi:hypothetical protein [Streptomyces eurocidicus]|uniref:Uncharacterized protein n=1 Tax=Streptomyces eurocidicus TaxID=66423 RepID=A0A7W8BI51_STREU|nr:hypothetical protein [Streptomyces eurocidicus]MBB5122801.1 hypothetical protein [Streptomyces eurocidicus]MBF6054330.1 hypothetical protein [Streptomyces eurocidicus]